MAISDARRRANNKYDKEKVERVVFRVEKGKKEILQAYCTQKGESINGFVNRLIDEEMKKNP